MTAYDRSRSDPAGLIDPVFQQSAASVRLTLAATPVDADAARHLPSHSHDVMVAIRDSGGLSTGDVADAIGMSKPATLRRLNALKDAGLVEWIGKSKKDPRAYWRLRSE